MTNTTIQWKLGKVEVKAHKDGLVVNGRTISWEDIDAAKRDVTLCEFRIPIIGTAK